MSKVVETKRIDLGLGKTTIKIDSNGRVIDFATGKLLKLLSNNPEETVRQWYEKVLINEYDFDVNQIDIEVPIQMGSTTKKADIIVFDSSSKSRGIIIVETKKPLKKDGISQLHSYLEATGVEFGVWTNGNDISYWYHGEAQSFEPIGRIIKNGETIEDIGAKKLREELVSAKDLVADFKAAEQYILAHQGGVDVFEELFKVIFAKIFDEKKNLKRPESEAHFRAGIKEPSSKVKQRIDLLFDGATNLYSDVFSENEKIKLNGQVLKWIILLLQNYILTETDMDVLGTGFEVLVNPKMKSDKGQYFTPRQVVRTAVEMLQIDEEMRIIDPACGSGGFLIYSMERVWKKLESEWASELDALAEKLAFAQNKIFGADYDDRLARVAKAYMAIWGDGRAHIYSVPCSIKAYEWKGEVSEQVKDGTFDALLTNPPFAGDLSLHNIAHHFDLGRKNGKELSSQRKDILFIERALNLVKPSKIGEKSGLIAIVLPKGDLDEREKQYVRDYILKNARLLAVISLHRFSFVPFTFQKTSLVFLHRMLEDEIPEDYDIFMAVSERPGKDKSGNLVYLRNVDNNLLLDEYGHPMLDTDLFEIIQDFLNKTSKIGFWIKKSQIVGRINAEYYHPKYMSIRIDVTKGDFLRLGDIILLKDGMINGKDLSAISKDGKRHYTESGLPYLRVGDVKENEIDFIGAEKIDPSEYDLSNIPKLKVGDLLVTRKGTTGRAAVVSIDEIDAILSSEIIRIRIKNNIELSDGRTIYIDPYYVAVFINSKYGKQLILQKQTGGISEGINHPELKEFEIPILSQEEMNNIATDYRKANEALKNARNSMNAISEKIINLI